MNTECKKQSVSFHGWNSIIIRCSHPFVFAEGIYIFFLFSFTEAFANWIEDRRVFQIFALWGFEWIFTVSEKLNKMSIVLRWRKKKSHIIIIIVIIQRLYGMEGLRCRQLQLSFPGVSGIAASGITAICHQLKYKSFHLLLCMVYGVWWIDAWAHYHHRMMFADTFANLYNIHTQFEATVQSIHFMLESATNSNYTLESPAWYNFNDQKERCYCVGWLTWIALLWPSFVWAFICDLTVGLLCIRWKWQHGNAVFHMVRKEIAEQLEGIECTYELSLFNWGNSYYLLMLYIRWPLLLRHCGVSMCAVYIYRWWDMGLGWPMLSENAWNEIDWKHRCCAHCCLTCTFSTLMECIGRTMRRNTHILFCQRKIGVGGKE